MMRMLVETLSAFVITSGSVLTGYMVQEGAATLPTLAALLVALIGGLIAAANQARAYVAQSPKA